MNNVHVRYALTGCITWSLGIVQLCHRSMYYARWRSLKKVAALSMPIPALFRKCAAHLCVPHPRIRTGRQKNSYRYHATPAAGKMQRSIPGPTTNRQVFQRGCEVKKDIHATLINVAQTSTLLSRPPPPPLHFPTRTKNASAL